MKKTSKMISRIKQIAHLNSRLICNHTFLACLLLAFLLILSSCSAPFEKDQPKLVEISPQQNDQQQSFWLQNILQFRDLKTAKIVKQKTKVALLLPMSGRNKDLGKVLYNSAIMSLFDNDLDSDIELVLFDTKSSPQDAKSAVNEIAGQDIKLIIGPVFSNELEAIKDDIAQNELTAISLSNNQKFIESDGIFLSGFFPEQQIERSIEYAISQNKLNFAAILPNNIYGKALADLIRESMHGKDTVFVTADFYQLSGDNLSRTVDRVIKSYLIPAELSEQIRKKEVPADFQISEEDKIRPQVLLIPEAGRQLANIAKSIKDLNKEEREFLLVGSSQWDNAATLSDRNLEGAIIAAPRNDRFRSFEKSYYQLHSEFPPRISSIMYDIVAATIEVNSSKRGDPQYWDFVHHKNSKNGFEGIDGLFRFLPNGLVQRSLAILKIENGRLVTIEEAPDHFLKYEQ